MPDPSTAARKVLVTGASSGIGRAIAERLLAEGHRVLGLARDFTKFPCAHPSFRPVSLDLAELDALPGALAALAAEHPDLDAVVLGAGKGTFGGLEQLSPEAIRSSIDLNFTAQALAARAFLPGMKKAGRGDLVFIGSEAARRGRRRGSIYCAGKFALRGFAQALREECSTSGVRVTIINPGLVRTPFFNELDFEPGEDPRNYLLAADVAAAVSLALSARAEAVIDEINLSPLLNVVRSKPPPEGKPPRGGRVKRG